MIRYLTLLTMTSLLFITSCTYVDTTSKKIFYQRDKDYLKATQLPPLTIPPGLTTKTIEAHYPVSEKNYPKNSQPIDLTPPEIIQPVKINKPISIQQNQEKIKLQATKPNYYFDPYTRSSQGGGVPITTLIPESFKKSTINAEQKAQQPQKAQNKTGKVEPEQSKMPHVYIDRYTHR